jgi:hypothetical protein
VLDVCQEQAFQLFFLSISAELPGDLRQFACPSSPYGRHPFQLVIPPYTNGDSTELSRSFASGGWADRVVRAVQHVAGTRYGPGWPVEEVPYPEWWMAADDNFVAIRIAPK